MTAGGPTDVVKRAQIARIPRDLAAAINRRFPEGMVDEFSTDESYFQAIHARVERDLRKIHGASLLWQTADEEQRGSLDGPDDEPPAVEWQSYYVFFLAPNGDAFHVLDGTGAIEASAEAEEDAAPDTWPDTTAPGDEWTGCAVGISLAAHYAVINFDCYARDEDGTERTPDVESFIYSIKGPGGFATRRTHSAGDLYLDVQGVGPIRLPVSQARYPWRHHIELVETLDSASRAPRPCAVLLTDPFWRRLHPPPCRFPSSYSGCMITRLSVVAAFRAVDYHTARPITPRRDSSSGAPVGA